jgi:hypothetical protein
MSVRGITSKASATARYGAPATPSMALAFLASATLIAISVAPPPGANVGLNTTFRATDMASARFRSISLRISFDGPRSKIVQAFGDLHSSMNVKYLRKEISEGGKQIATLHILVTKLLDMEKTTFSTHVRFPQIVNPVDNRGADCSRYTVVVGLSDSSNRSNRRVCLQEVVLSQI